MGLVDLTSIKWTKSSGSGVGSNGCYFKAKIKEKDGYYYYKLSAFDSSRGFYGHESFNEVIVSRLCNILGIECADYKLVYIRVKINNQIYNTFACKSKSYKSLRCKSISFEDYYILNRMEREGILEFIERLGMASFIQRMILIDYLTINRDRHGANLEILSENGKEKMAPLFDNGLSFVCSITEDLYDYKKRLSNFDIFVDLPVNNYIGQRSLLSNLNLINGPIKINKLTKEHKRKIFYGMNSIIDKEYIAVIWKIIVYRYMFLRKQGLIMEVP